MEKTYSNIHCKKMKQKSKILSQKKKKTTHSFS